MRPYRYLHARHVAIDTTNNEQSLLRAIVKREPKSDFSQIYDVLFDACSRFIFRSSDTTPFRVVCFLQRSTQTSYVCGRWGFGTVWNPVWKRSTRANYRRVGTITRSDGKSRTLACVSLSDDILSVETSSETLTVDNHFHDRIAYFEPTDRAEQIPRRIRTYCPTHPNWFWSFKLTLQ